ncbi:hypothetical protein BpHYR1_008121 [Brachionus plicatilis]|uniref:Uncharacterized protein n=1 Tax=Brachionus plicatilis TaxID=10195 RepID=A0A3M7RG99_BRAPC|nr:hypothetical protein BpHYR1_008121 [Brachionus plicatilis]
MFKLIKFDDLVYIDSFANLFRLKTKIHKHHFFCIITQERTLFYISLFFEAFITRFTSINLLCYFPKGNNKVGYLVFAKIFITILNSAPKNEDLKKPKIKYLLTKS